VFAQKGNRKLSKSASDVFTYPAVKVKTYAAQKPVELLADLCSLSFYPGEHILDPCCGSGSIFHAAKATKLRATGIELNPIAIGIAKNAMSDASR
jgi:DNA modification methylase